RSSPLAAPSRPGSPTPRERNVSLAKPRANGTRSATKAANRAEREEARAMGFLSSTSLAIAKPTGAGYGNASWKRNERRSAGARGESRFCRDLRQRGEIPGAEHKPGVSGYSVVERRNFLASPVPGGDGCDVAQSQARSRAASKGAVGAGIAVRMEVLGRAGVGLDRQTERRPIACGVVEEAQPGCADMRAKRPRAHRGVLGRDRADSRGDPRPHDVSGDENGIVQKRHRDGHGIEGMVALDERARRAR